MARQRKPRTIALCDNVLAALEERGNATATEIAALIGTLPCACLASGYPGRPIYPNADGRPCRCTEDSGPPGWRNAGRWEISPIVKLLERDGMVTKVKVNGRALYSLGAAFIGTSVVE